MAESSNQQPKPFNWTATSDRAAFLVAEDRLTDEAISAECGINRTTLFRWKRHPDFARDVEKQVDDIQKHVRRIGYGRLDQRLSRYAKRLDQIDKVFTERGLEMEKTGEAAGGSTGLLIRVPKSITITYEADPNDPDSKDSTSRSEAFEYRSDTQLLREERELLKQYSIEVGQFAEKRELTGTEGGPIQISSIEVVLDDHQEETS